MIYHMTWNMRTINEPSDFIEGPKGLHSLLINIMLLQDIEALSSDASQLIPQHNYKLDVHALNSRRPGEV